MNERWQKSILGATLLVTLTGCLGKNDDYPIRGFVCTVAHEVSESYLLPAKSMPRDGKPIQGAKVYLAFDKEGKNVVKGFDAESDRDGSYTIRVKGIPPSPSDPAGDYYIFVEKEGFQSLVNRISIGPLSQYLQNTAVLKPAGKR